MKWLTRNLLLLLRDLAPFARGAEVAVLCYHSIGKPDVATAITPAEFKRQLAYLKENGYAFIPLDLLLDWYIGKTELSGKAVALTFDDGYADFETATLPILEKFEAPAALFVMGDPEKSRPAIANEIPLLAPKALERIGNHPLVTLGYHSLTHANLSRLEGEALVPEMRSTFATKYFAYPGGNYSTAAISTARDLGYSAAFSIKRHLVAKGGDPFLLPRSVVTRDMSLRTVRFHATRALEWYRALGNLRNG